MTVKELERQSLFCNTVIRDSMSVCGDCGENPIHCGMYHPCSRVERFDQWDGLLHKLNRHLEVEGVAV